MRYHILLFWYGTEVTLSPICMCICISILLDAIKECTRRLTVPVTFWLMKSETWKFADSPVTDLDSELLVILAMTRVCTYSKSPLTDLNTELQECGKSMYSLAPEVAEWQCYCIMFPTKNCELLFYFSIKVFFFSNFCFRDPLY